jgi:membrane associated rhomboid family serine protease
MINLTPAVKQLLRINVIVFILTYFLYALKISFVENFILFNVGSQYFQPYQLVTYMFLHSSALHIVFNMLGLVTFGPDIEERFGSKKFLQYYLVMGVVSGLCHALFITNPVLGASGAIWGIMMLYALFNPNTILHLYFLIPVKVKYIVSVFFSIELLLALTGSNDGVSHIAHVGGALTGVIIYLLNRK